MVVAALIFMALAYVLVPRMLNLARDKPKMPPAAAAMERSNPNTEVTSAQPVSSLEEIRQRALQGDPQAQFAIGLRYAVGENEPQDYAIAARWFLKAAEQGMVLAQDNLGAYYWAGRGVPKDVVKAFYWSSVAKEAGNAASEVRVQFLTPQLTREQAAAIQRQAAEFYKQHPPLKTESTH
jgi:TPR repeat protein